MAEAPRGPAERAERGGVLLRVGGAPGEEGLGFVPAEVARRLTALSSLTPVPGTRPPVVGIALADGAVVTVLQVGPGAPAAPASYEPGDDWMVPGADRAVLCNLGGVDVALTGATVVATGIFDGAPGGDSVLWRSEVVPILDVRALYAQAEAASWAERAASLPARALGGGAQAEDEGRRGVLPEEPGEGGQRGSGA